MAVTRNKRPASEDPEDATHKKQRLEQAPKEKRNATKEALSTAPILRNILCRLPLLERLCARRINKSFKDTIDTFPDLYYVPFYDPIPGPREFIFWQPYDKLGNNGPFIADARWEDKLQAYSPAPIITVNPLIERMDAYVKQHSLPRSAMRAQPAPGKFGFKLRIYPQWLVAMERDFRDRRWRNMYITQPPCLEIKELELAHPGGITLGLLADECVRMQAMERLVKQLDEEEDVPAASPFKVELFGVREGSFPVRMARGEIERGTLFVPALHGF